MAHSGRTFRIFVSSTFEDLKEERNALQERVFPKLRELCTQYGCRFQAIDLRWGVSEEASLDQQTVKICLEEIKRCRKVTPRPNFIVLLGDRYGWRPLPYEIPASEFKEIERHITDVEEKRLLNTWYKRDDNAVPPVYCLQRRTGKPVIANGVKQSPQPADYEDHAIWEKKVERPLRMALLNAVNKIDCFGQNPRNDDSSLRPVNEGGMSQSGELSNGKQFPRSVIASETKQSPTIDRLKYIASATEQEIVHGALTVPDANEHVFCFFRKINDLPVTPPPPVGQASSLVITPSPTAEQASPLVIKTNDFIDLDVNANPDKEASALLDNLKARLRTRLPGNIHEYNTDWKDGRITTSHIEKLCDDVYQSLSRVILREIEQFKDIDPLEKEITDHYEFGKKLTAFFVGRAAVRKTIQDYVKANARHPLVIYGESGSGKSAVMAQTISDCGMRMADYTVISRFIGATPTSSDGRSLLEGLCQEISRRYGVDQTNIPKEYRELVQEFPKRLALATKEKPLIVFLDALDQLSDTDYARNLVWLPSELPENVSVVVSTLPGKCLTTLENKLSANNLAQHSRDQKTPLFPPFARGDTGGCNETFQTCTHENVEKKFLHGSTIIKLEPMPQAEGEALLDTWLEDAGRKLQAEQKADILAKFRQNGLPLYLKLAFEEARRWKSYDGLPCGADKETGLNKDISGVIRDLFWRLSLESNHGRVLVSHCFSYLAAAKNGLTEDEMLDVLSRKEEVIKDFQRRSPKSPRVTRLPVVVWSRLYFDMEQYLTERSADGTSLMTFFHRQFREVVEEDYLSGALKQTYHRDLGRYFWDQPHWIETFVAVHPHPNLPHQGGGIQGDNEHSPQGDPGAAPQGNTEHPSQGDSDAATQGSNECSPQGNSGATIQADNEHSPQDGTGAITQGNDKNSPPSVGGARGGGEQSQADKNRKPNLRKVSELPYQQTYGEMKKQLETTLTDLDFLEAKCTAGMTYDLAADYDRLGVGRAQAGPPIRTAWVHEGKHGVMCPFCLGWNEIQLEQLGKVIPCPSCKSGMKLNLFTTKAEWKPSGAQRKVDRTEKVKTMDLSPDVGEFADFIRNQSHILRDYPGLIFQQAHNWPDNTAVHRATNKYLDLWTKTHPWLRWVNKPQQTDPCLATLRGHTRDVNACAYSPDGRHIVSGSSDSTLKIWDARSGAEVATLQGHSEAVVTCAYSPDGRRIVSGSRDNTLKIWNAESGAEVATLRGHSGCVNACTYSPDGSRIVSGSDDNKLKIWDAGSGAEVATLRGHSGYVRACACLPDGRLIVSGSWDETLKVWDAGSGAEVATLRGHSHSVSTCAYSPDGRRIVSDSDYNTLKVWDAESGVEIATLRGHSGYVRACAYSPDGHRIVSGSYDNTLKMWDAESGAEVATLQGYSRCVNACAYSPDGRHIVYGSADDTLKIWDVESDVEVDTLRGHTRDVNACAYSLDGRRIVSGSDDKTLKIWDAGSGAEVATLRGHSVYVRACAYSPDGRRIVSGSWDETLKVWDAESGAEVATLQWHSHSVNTCAYSPDGRRVVSDDSDYNTLKIWDAESGMEVATLRGHAESVNACAYSPDGRRIVSGSGDNTLKIWDAESGGEVATLRGHSSWVNTCAYSLDGRRIVSGSRDNTIKIWDAGSGAEVATLRGHSRWVNACAYSPDGRRIVSGSDDKTLKIWDARSGAEICTFISNDCVSALALNPAGTDIFAGDSGGMVYLLRLKGLDPGPVIITPWRLPTDGAHAFGCVHCRVWSEIPASAIGTELSCPNCGKPVKLNPFTINADWRPIAKAWGGKR